MSKFDAMAPEEIGQLFPIEVVPYDERWQQLFMAEAARVSGTLGDEVCAIEHIGSTAVPGLAAKPIIDSLLLVNKLDSRAKQRLIEKLRPLGYENMTNAETELTMEFGKDTTWMIHCARNIISMSSRQRRCRRQRLSFVIACGVAASCVRSIPNSNMSWHSSIDTTERHIRRVKRPLCGASQIFNR